MEKIIQIEQLFYKKEDSYGVINAAKAAEESGYKYIKVNKLVKKLSIRYFMFIVVTLSINEKSIKEILYEMKNIYNWRKHPEYRFYYFKPIEEVLQLADNTV